MQDIKTSKTSKGLGRFRKMVANTGRQLRQVVGWADSEDECDQRPSFGDGGGQVPQSKPQKSRKRPYSAISAFGDAGMDENKGDNLKPSAFVRDKTESVEMSAMARKMMAKMGHKEGEGLGKHGQGRKEIVEASTQRGRRGLGMVVAGLEPRNVDWDFGMEEIVIDEIVDWLPQYRGDIPVLEELLQWKVIGPKKRDIDDETNFCSEESLMMVLNGKNVFDQLEPEEMRRARTRSNPYETIRGAFFLNRAAMKMANMDAVLDFMFTNPKQLNGEPLVERGELFYFADICAGPGGFSEYVLWRTKGESKGFGLTLKGNNDFKVEDFFAGPPEMFEPHYGKGGLDGDGDIFNVENQREFKNFVLDSTDRKGVHFVMADGGFSVEGQENIQEILSKQLYLCQFLVAISVLRTGGNFVCKLFDLFTPFSAGLVYLMNMIFDQVAIFKPVTSRPANSERYIVCKGLKPNKQPVQEYMHLINVDLNKYMSAVSTEDVTDIVPLETLLDDKPFFDYLLESNEHLAKIQAIGLKKIEVFTQNSQLHETRQSEVRSQCLEKWKIPDRVRAAPGRPEPNTLFQSLIKNESQGVFEASVDSLGPDNLSKIKCLSSYRCLVRAEGPSFYLLGCGRSSVFKWDGKGKTKWQKLEGARVELPSKTLLEVQAVTELRGEGKGQRRQTTLHVLDAFFLCGEDIRNMSFEERQTKLSKFVKALRKPTRSDLTQLVKPGIFPLEKVEQVFDNLSMRIVKGSLNKPRLCYKEASGNYFHPAGLTLIKVVKEPWIVAHSKSTGHQYWYNIITRKAVYECPPDSIATAKDCKSSMLTWVWTDGVKVHSDQEREDPSLLNRDLFMSHIHKLSHS
ncbi:CAP-specific mRNA (nucleoside-2'-O-)-methyltransferase 1 [Elysia marginata]|uniref:Cap-specific mRNA (nucleoside-2'-O-)-methyltransferase 1 n=1 Tax=Elysia marginata TaxID=1093978 RepID=A0AAV4F7E8_9GAST|nr:CAP-specific mRNA (nucleoside-2'-O-)-methyltransferase 1 [Elysia marginata]